MIISLASSDAYEDRMATISPDLEKYQARFYSRYIKK